MASSKEYLDFILEQLSDLDDVSHRAMMEKSLMYKDSNVEAMAFQTCSLRAKS